VTFDPVAFATAARAETDEDLRRLALEGLAACLAGNRMDAIEFLGTFLHITDHRDTPAEGSDRARLVACVESAFASL